MRDAVICEPIRTPVGGFGGSLRDVSVKTLAATVLAVELAPAVRVNAVAPAVVKTRFAAAVYEGREEQLAASYPAGRLGVPEDVASAVAFLLSDDASWITGHTMVLDGGSTLVGAL